MSRRALDEFYVGYLAIPPGQRRFLQMTIPVCLVLMLASALALAIAQPAPGNGVWNVDEAVTLTGDLFATPHPMLEVSEPAEKAGLYIIVRSGKRGAADLVGPHALTRASVRGYILHRDGRRIIELDDAADAIAPAQAQLQPSLDITWGRDTTTLQGEVLDAKCYLGAMKPGHGRGHKACAITCIEGGIPPMLVTTGDDGAPEYHLLVDQVGRALRGDALAALLPRVGEPLALRGRPGVLGEWRMLAVDTDTSGLAAPRPRR